MHADHSVNPDDLHGVADITIYVCGPWKLHGCHESWQLYSYNYVVSRSFGAGAYNL